MARQVGAIGDLTFDDSCPWCGTIVHDMWEYFGQGDDAEFECPVCDKPLLGRWEVSYRLEAIASEAVEVSE